ncbi:hypothetical protein C6P45_003399 [Maudiozyma exigua]|uniref:Rab-GAP TBC domain-containing protein n=1 Tax=Maudiozyma exigua TaxID=34358 RepID=A0A9P6VTJ7_MAUEX|nr:hypothetical protein C6P45_003399 [Kazachstania exigua]
MNSLYTLVSVPLLSETQSQSEESHHEHNSHKLKTTLFNPLKHIMTNDKNNKRIRKLTPNETHSHPLLISPDSNSDDPSIEIGMNINDTLEIIDLDLSRLIISPIFQDPFVHGLMRKILFNYLLISNKDNNADDILKQTYYYRQGFHEILAVIFLQFYHRDTTITEEQIKFILFIFIKLMDPLRLTFYQESQLLTWQQSYFIRILKLCDLDLYKILYGDTSMNNHNLIWLIRWTRLLFLRELPMEDCLVIWDHILTFSYSMDVMVACLVISILVVVKKDLTKIDKDEQMDNDDIIEYLLQFDKRGSKLNVLQVCQLSGLLCEAWESGHWKELNKIVLNHIRNNNIDPNRKRLEDKLRKRVQKIIE